jgi:CRISPR-associated protein Cst1
MSISLTGNPFVDTGLAVLAFRSGCKNIEELTLEKMKKVHGDGKELASRNSKLKSTTIIFTVNSLVTHPGIKPIEKRIQFYSKITTALLNKIGFEDVQDRCESCGNEYSLDIDKLIRETLVPLGYKDETRYTGRDWFPLAGSMGSDAQALPAGSRSPNLCAKCLFAVHYLPQGVMLRDGRLTVFQSTSRAFWFNYVTQIVKTVEERILASNFNTLGSKEGTASVIENTFRTMDNMKKIESGISLIVWMFSNSGQGPDCRVEEIPNNALQFLFDARNEGYREEIINLVKKDKNPEYAFLNCISKGVDYNWLYPSKKSTGVPPGLFLLYQTKIRNVSGTALQTACKIAQYLKDGFPEAKKFEDFRKDIKNDLAKKNRIKKCIVEMVNNASLSLREYEALFAQDSDGHIGINSDGWKFITYYTHNTERGETENQQAKAKRICNELLLYIGRKIFDDQIENRGAVRFRKDVLDRFALGKITTSWLRRQFLKGASLHEGFNYDAWKALCLNGRGIETTYETLFRLRLMWSEWLRTEVLPEISEYPKTDIMPYPTDMPSDVEKIAYKIGLEYINKRGQARLKKDLIDELIKGEKDLYWLRDRFSRFDSAYSDDTYWERFCTDQEGYAIKNLRLFQFSLIFINFFREQAFKDNPI